MKVKLLCGLLAAGLCLSLVPSLTWAQPRPLQWVKINIPGPEGNVVVSPSEVTEIAIGTEIFYAIDSENSKFYRSLNGGASWENITKYLLRAGAGLPATKITIASDSPSIVAVVTNSGTSVYLSVDGGITWANTNVPPVTGAIQSIAISKQYSRNDGSFRDVAIGTAIWGDGLTTGQVWILKLGVPVTSWRNLGLWVDNPALPSPHTGGEVSAIAFSPRYADDRTILVIASTGADLGIDVNYRNKTFLCLGQRDFTTGTAKWNGHILPGYPVEIADPPGASSGDAPGVAQIVSGLALPSTYSNATGAPSSLRKVFAFCDSQPNLLPGNNVYRIDDTTPKKFAGAPTHFSSISLHGSKLMAGEVNPSPPGLITVPVRVTLNAFAVSPAWDVSPLGEPSGQGNAKVAWSPDGRLAYCGTGKNPGVPPPPPPGPPDESAFSISTDNGQTWIQVSLIDTTLTLQDLAVASSPKGLFIVSTSTTNIESVWRSAGEPLGQYWGRVLVIDAPSNKVILRMSPDYQIDYTMYVAEVGGALMWVTNDRGNSWKGRHAPGQIVDMVVADKNVVYVALSNGTVAKSTTGAISWHNPVPTCLPQTNMLSLANEETLLVGGQNGDVAYSTDAGISFTRILPTIGSGAVQVVADADYQKNGIIFAGAGNGIYCWTVGYSVYWQPMRSLSASRQISGIVVADGVLYSAWYDTTAPGSGVERCLEPAIPLVYLEWDTLQIGAGAARFSSTPASLRFSTANNEINLWAIDTVSSALMVYCDSLAKVVSTIPPPVPAPPGSLPVQENPPPLSPPSAPASPGNDREATSGISLVLLAPMSGATDIPTKPEFRWQAPAGVTEYEVALAKDTSLTAKIASAKVTTSSWQLPTSLDPGTTYFWGVRTTKPTVGPWTISSFTTISELLPSPATAPRSSTSQVTHLSLKLWIIIGLGIALIIGLVVMIRRRAV